MAMLVGAGATVGGDRDVFSHIPVAREKAAQYDARDVALKLRGNRHEETTR
jgi:hypothetical protein